MKGLGFGGLGGLWPGGSWALRLELRGEVWAVHQCLPVGHVWEHGGGDFAWSDKELGASSSGGTSRQHSERRERDPGQEHD